MGHLMKDKVVEVLSNIASHLKGEAKLVLIGSTVGILLGQEERMTVDIDVWMRDSDFDYGDLKQACEKAGVTFDPTSYDEPKEFYLQIVREGVCQVGDFDKEVKIMRFGKMLVASPPIENIIASKMTRASEDDIKDSVFLMAVGNVAIEDVKRVINTFVGEDRNLAMENLVFLEMATCGNGCSCS